MSFTLNFLDMPTSDLSDFQELNAMFSNIKDYVDFG